MLLRLEYLNPQILAELNMESLDAKIYPIDTADFDLIDELLQANYTAASLQEYCKKVKDTASL